MLRRLLVIFVVFVLAALVVADRVADKAGERLLASKVQHDEDLPIRPSVTISGFPFLTQAIRGKYSNVSITAREVPVSGVDVTRLTAHLHGVSVDFSRILHGSVPTVPVDRVDGSAFVSYADANAYLATHHPAHTSVTVSPGTGQNLRVKAVVTIGSSKVTLVGSSKVSIAANVVKLSLSRLKPTSNGAGLQTVAKLAPVTIPLQDLPFHIDLRTITVGASGLTTTGTATHVILGD